MNNNKSKLQDFDNLSFLKTRQDGELVMCETAAPDIRRDVLDNTTSNTEETDSTESEAETTAHQIEDDGSTFPDLASADVMGETEQQTACATSANQAQRPTCSKGWHNCLWI